jgi:hypothetical protein
MKEGVLSSSLWGVSCHRCSLFIPLYAEEASPDKGQGSAEVLAHAVPAAVFLAWCGHCGRESQFLTTELRRSVPGQLPVGFRPHPLFKRQKRQERADAATGA